jgi:hypothetical protein
MPIYRRISTSDPVCSRYFMLNGRAAYIHYGLKTFVVKLLSGLSLRTVILVLRISNLKVWKNFMPTIDTVQNCWARIEPLIRSDAYIRFSMYFHKQQLLEISSSYVDGK